MAVFRTIMAVLTVFIEFIILTPWMIYCMNLTKKGDKESIEKRDMIAPKLIRFMAGCVMWWSGAKVEIEGAENIPDEPCVLVGNHQSYFDILCLLSNVRPMFGYMAKVEMLKVPFLRSWMKCIDCVFLDRSNARQGLKAIKEAADFVKAGRSIYIFPEGTRSKSDTISEFKGGAMMVATKEKAPIVPFLIDGTYKIFEANGIGLKPVHVKYKFLPPISTDNLTKTEANELTNTIRDLLLEEQRKNESNTGTNPTDN